MSHFHSAADLRPASQYWADHMLVVQERETVVGEAIPLFGDDVWDLRCIAFRANISTSDYRLDFRQFADPVRRITAKELVMQRLNRPLPASRRSKRPIPISAPTATDVVAHLRRIWEFMDGRNIPRLADLRQDDLNAFLRALTAKQSSPKHHAYVLKTFCWLYESREWLTYDRLSFIPWAGKSLLRVVGYQHPEENTTPRIPEAVMSPLLRWSLAYIDLFAPDIIAALRFEAEVENRVTPKAGLGEAESKLMAWLDGLRAQRQPLPGYRRGTGVVTSTSIIAHMAGVAESSLTYHREAINVAASELGVASPGLGVSISVPPGADQPWCEPFDFSSLKVEARHLIEACYVVCTYLSGMRDSEVQGLRRGCYQPTLDEQGGVLRHKVQATAYKGSGAAGEERTWVVIEPVVRAIRVLEQATEWFAQKTGSDLLMVNLHSRQQGVSIKSSINRRLTEFRDHVNQTLAPRLPGLGIGPIPGGQDGTPWPFSTRQFRRTVAWHIANRPFGTVAGMLQYGHTAEMIFEGYAGSSTSGFLAEVEAERALARQADIVEMYEDFKRGIAPAGPMASELMSEFDHIRNGLGDLPGKVIDERRRDKLLRHLRVRLFPGLLADCFFAAEDARCLRHIQAADRHEPVAGICDPHCPNACWTKKHLAVWDHTLADTAQLGKRNQISPIQRDILQAKVAECRTVIAAIRDAANVR